MSTNKHTLFWFRRDLRLNDNAGLYHALKERSSVLPIFIFDTDILSHLDDPEDPRVSFIHETLTELKKQLQKKGSDLRVFYGTPLEVFKKIFAEVPVEAIYANHDYEPLARKRDAAVEDFCRSRGIEFLTFKDQTLFEKEEILTDSRKPYTVYTPYKKKVYAHLNSFYLKSYPTWSYQKSLAPVPEKTPMLSLQDIGFRKGEIVIPPLELSASMLKNYAKNRDFPALAKGTSHLGIHLRFGTVSVRELAREGKKHSETWLSELVWRDFFMQILWHYPRVETESFRPEYDKIAWRSSPGDFSRWSEGMTGYPLVDAGMRELNQTGHMHNRVRMVVASFLCKHLLIHWSQGERYFAKKLLDFDLSANNGNWQWAAGSGCDAAPYFRIFNPHAQAQRFDSENEYIQKWVPEWQSPKYPKPIIEHTVGRDRCLRAFTQVLKTEKK